MTAQNYIGSRGPKRLNYIPYPDITLPVIPCLQQAEKLSAVDAYYAHLMSRAVTEIYGGDA